VECKRLLRSLEKDCTRAAYKNRIYFDKEGFLPVVLCKRAIKAHRPCPPRKVG